LAVEREGKAEMLEAKKVALEVSTSLV